MSDDENDAAWDSAEELETERADSACLFCGEVRASPELVYEHCAHDHAFSIKDAVRGLQLDCFGYIKMVNYARKHKTSPEVLQTADPRCLPWEDDQYLVPVVQDDLLLTYDVEELVSAGPKPEDEREQLRNRLLQAEQAIERMREVAQSWLQSNEQAEPVEHDEPYFESYGHHGIHLEMLSDRPRMDSYRKAIELNADDCIRNRTVLDVGCGTGILSMLCARAGARSVVGIDQSGVVYNAMDIVRENGLSERVNLVHGRVEELELPERVDVLVSEWMGYFLLFEGMLESVLQARDRLLRPGGLMLPSHCQLFLVALSDNDINRRMVSFWDNVEGFKMSCMRKEVLAEAHVMDAPASSVCSERPALLLNLDLNTCRMEESDFVSDFELDLKPGTQQVTALAGYFDCTFELPVPVVLSTAMEAESTHWKQTVFLLEEPLLLAEGEKTVRGRLECRRQGRRELLVTITLGPIQQQQYTLH
ncbi:protein arginine N-methyltransferase 3 [Rhipicephalus sanguineus]|uniref:protein arginine N-methyltransferase 3 n=1 Tax=Rhipicephalus sanguineus TaxID=34632 RepID=UPI001895A50B|nr:protein arginine N-methyltransferase 3 [Rhipicephalus sanguineus]